MVKISEIVNSLAVPSTEDRYLIADISAEETKYITHGMLNGLYTLKVNSVAVLRTTEPSFTGQIITLLGHTTAGIGGGDFRADFSDTTSVDDNGITIVTAGGKRWKRVINDGIIIPQFWGAVGNNSTDNIVPFRSAITYVKKNKTTLTIPEGTYILSDELIIADSANVDRYYFKIIGSGKKSCILKFTNHDTVYRTTISSMKKGLVIKSVNGLEQGGLGLVDLKEFTIQAPQRGIAMLLLESNSMNIDIGFETNGGTLAGGNCVLHHLVIEGCIKINVSQNTFSEARLFNILLSDFNDVDLGYAPGSSPIYNDSIWIEENSFNGSCFACVLDTGSNGGFGLRSANKNIISGNNKHYFYIAGRGLNFAMDDNWSESTGMQLLLSFRGDEASNFVVSKKHTTIVGVPDSFLYGDYFNGGWNYNLTAENNTTANGVAGYDCSGFRENVSITGHTYTGTASNLLYHVKPTNIAACNVKVTPPFILNTVSPHFNVLADNTGRGRLEGYSKQEGGNRYDVVASGTRSSTGGFTSAVDKRYETVLACSSHPVYPVIQIQSHFAGVYEVELYRTGASGQASSRYKAEITTIFNSGSLTSNTTPNRFIVSSAKTTSYEVDAGTFYGTPNVDSGIYYGYIDSRKFDVAKTITNTTLADPAVFTTDAHGLINNDVVLLEGTGVTTIDNVLFIVKNTTTNTFTLVDLEGKILDTRGLTLTNGTVKKVISEATMYIGFGGFLVGDSSDSMIATIRMVGGIARGRSRGNTTNPIFTQTTKALAESAIATHSGVAMAKILPPPLTTVDSVAILRITEPSFTGQIITILGHTTTGIGGGQFRADLSDTTTVDDNGVTIVTVGGKRWKRVLIDNQINIQFYNAIGDGTTNNTVAFETALSKNPSVLYVPSGTYIVNPTNDSHITVGSSTRIIGDGIGVSTIKLANNAIVNTDSVYNKFKSIFRCLAPTPAFGIVDITLDGNRENQLYPLTRTGTGSGIGRGSSASVQAVLELASDGTNRGNRGTLNCEIKNGYFCGLLAIQCDDLDIQYLNTHDNSTDGMFALACNRLVGNFVTARNGYFKRSTPDNGFTVSSDACGIHLRSVGITSNTNTAKIPIISYPNGDYWNGATINLMSSTDDGVCAIWAGIGGNLNLTCGVLKNVGRGTSAINYNPCFVWIESVFGANIIDAGICIQENIDAGDKKPTGIVTFPFIGEKSPGDTSVPVNLPDGEGHIHVKSAIFVSNQDYTSTIGDYRDTVNWKNNFTTFIESYSNVTFDYVYGEGSAGEYVSYSSLITLINPYNASNTSGSNYIKNIKIKQAVFRNFTSGKNPVAIRKYISANGNAIENIELLGFDVRDNRSTAPNASEGASFFHWGTDLDVDSKNIKIEGIFDLTNIDDNSRKMNLISFRGGSNSELYINSNVKDANDIILAISNGGLYNIKGRYECTSLVDYNFGSNLAKGVVFDGYAKCSSTVIANIGNNKIIDAIHINGIIDGDGGSSAIISNYASVNIKDEKIYATTTNHTLAYTASNLTNGSIGSSSNPGLQYAKFLNYTQVAYTADQQGVMLFPFITPVGTINPRPINTSGATITSLSGNFKLRGRVKKNTDLEGVSIQSLTTIPAYAQVIFNVTVSGAMMGDFVTSIAYSNAMSSGSNHVYLYGFVSAPHTVTVVMTNRGAGTYTFNTDVLFKVLVTPRLSCKKVASATYDPASLVAGNILSVPAGASASTTISVAEALLGDFVSCSFSNNLSKVAHQAYVSSDGVITVRFQNWSPDVIDLASGTLYVTIDN